LNIMQCKSGGRALLLSSDEKRSYPFLSPDQVVVEEAPFSVLIPSNLFSDPDGNSLNYGVTLADGSPLPGWLAFDANTGELSGTAPLGSADIDVRITATDPGGLTASDVFRILTTQAPVIRRGIVTTDLSPGVDQAFSVIQQSDGKLVVAGVSNSDWALTRYNTNGTLDTSFGGGDGIVATTAGSSVLQQADGKLVVTGSTEGGAGSDIILMRHQADGSVDTSFGDGDGIVITNLGADGSSDHGSIVVQQADGNLVVAGWSDGDFALVRYHGDGSLDTSFGGGDGIVIAAASHSGSVVQQTDGKWVVVGTTGLDGSNWNIALSRYNADGTTDTTFGGGDGTVTTDFAGGHDLAFSVVQQADGKLIVAGSSETDFEHWDLALARFNPDGTLDTTFGGGDGMVASDLGGGFDAGFDLIEQSDGEVVVVGVTSDFEGYYGQYIVARYQADGTLGKVTRGGSFFNVGATYWQADAIEQTDGMIVAVVPLRLWGDGVEPPDVFGLVRYRPDGAPDDTFASLGDQSVQSGRSFWIVIPEGSDGFVVDPDGADLAYTVTQANGDPLPAWMMFRGSTRTLSGIPPTGGDDVTLRVTATDRPGASASLDFTLSIIDRFDSTASNESFTAGPGEDLFVFANAFGQDQITDFAPGEDVIDLSGVTNPDWMSFADVQAHMTQVSADTLIDLGGGNTITLVGVAPGSLTAGDFLL